MSAYSASQDHHPDCPVHLGDSILCRCHDLGPVPTVKRARGTSNRLVTGSSYDRRRRRQWLLDTYGDGQTAPCALRTSARCLGTVDAKTLTVDRIIPGALGGSYRRENIRPACGPCNFGGGTAVLNTEPMWHYRVRDTTHNRLVEGDRHMANVTICDKCGDQIDAQRQVARDPARRGKCAVPRKFNAGSEVHGGMWEWADIDLCHNCRLAFVRWMNQGADQPTLSVDRPACG